MRSGEPRKIHISPGELRTYSDFFRKTAVFSIKAGLFSYILGWLHIMKVLFHYFCPHQCLDLIQNFNFERGNTFIRKRMYFESLSGMIELAVLETAVFAMS